MTTSFSFYYSCSKRNLSEPIIWKDVGGTLSEVRFCLKNWNSPFALPRNRLKRIGNETVNANSSKSEKMNSVRNRCDEFDISVPPTHFAISNFHA